MEETMSKSDVKAKEAYIKFLRSQGFDEAHVTARPADITARKNGETYYFEIKKTSKEKLYFGAATLTEWAEAVENSEHYKFVVAKERNETDFDFIEYTPEELLEYSYIPPFKVYFNIYFDSNKKQKKKLTPKHIIEMKEFYDKLINADEED